MTEYYSKTKLQLQMKCGKALKGSLIIFDLDIALLNKEKSFFKIFGFCIILFNHYFWMNFNFVPKKLMMVGLNNKMIIDKNTDYKQVIKDFPIHWSPWRETGIKKIVEECKITGNKYELTLDKKTVYKLKRIENV